MCSPPPFAYAVRVVERLALEVRLRERAGTELVVVQEALPLYEIHVEFVGVRPALPANVGQVVRTLHQTK